MLRWPKQRQLLLLLRKPQLSLPIHWDTRIRIRTTEPESAIVAIVVLPDISMGGHSAQVVVVLVRIDQRYMSETF